MAQPPLSTQIRLLEEELGAQLFDRDKRRVFLTQAGREMLGRAREVLAAAEHAKKATRSAALGETGELNLGFTPSAMFTEVLPAAMRRFQKRHPHVQINVHEMTSQDQLYAVHNRELDVGILRRPDVATPAGVRIEEWYRAPLVAAIPRVHPLAKREALKVVDLEDQPLIVFPRESGIGLHWKVMELCVKAGFRPRIAREARDYSVIIGLVSAGVGIAVVPTDAQCIRLEGVAFRPMLGKDVYSALQICYRPTHRNEHLGSLLTELRAGRS